MDDLADSLRDLRRRALLTQEELARRSGVSVGTIAGLESGRTRSPRIASLRLLAEAMNLDDEQRETLVAIARSQPEPDSVPAGLPADPGTFTGRIAQLQRLDELTARPTATVVISGMPGVGKTAFAVHWAHRQAARFPDGCVFLNLRGFDQNSEPMQPAEAVRHLLEALTATPRPPTVTAQFNRYRELLAQRQVLIVLDDARDADQVRPLLADAPGCTVLVTSRNQLPALIATDGAQPLVLDSLSAAEGRALLAARLGDDRVDAEPGAVEDIVDRCARLPLALAVVAARATLHPTFPLAALARELGDIDGLDSLGTGEPATDLRAVFSWSVQTLDAPAVRLFRLLGTYCGGQFTAGAAASLAAMPVRAARAALAQLSRASLITEHSPGWYAMHDLLRAFATDLAGTSDDTAAMHRLLDYYLQSAHRCHQLIGNCQQRIDLTPPSPGVTVDDPADREQAAAWFTGYYAALPPAVNAAADRGLDTHAWQLAWSLRTFMDWRGHVDELIDLQRTALAAATRLSDQRAQAKVHRALAIALLRDGRHTQAHEHHEAAAELIATLGDPDGYADVQRDLALLQEQQGRPDTALDHLLTATRFYQSTGNKLGMARCLADIGWMRALLGAYAQSLQECEEALRLLEPFGDRYAQACVLDTIGYVKHQLGEYSEAADYYRRAIDRIGMDGDRQQLSGMLNGLATACETGGDLDGARSALLRAVPVLEGLGDAASVERVRKRLDQLDHSHI